MFNWLIKGPLYTKQITTFQTFALITSLGKVAACLINDAQKLAHCNMPERPLSSFCFDFFSLKVVIFETN